MNLISIDPTFYRMLLWEKFADCDYMEALKLAEKVYESGDQETADEMNRKIQENKKLGYYNPVDEAKESAQKDAQGR